VMTGQLNDGFTQRDITQNDWSNLKNANQVRAGLNLLVEHGWLAQQSVMRGGRPTMHYWINPESFAT
jgi:hypothetical protein